MEKIRIEHIRLTNPDKPECVIGMLDYERNKWDDMVGVIWATWKQKAESIQGIIKKHSHDCLYVRLFSFWGGGVGEINIFSKNCKFRRSVSFLTAFDVIVKVLLQGSLFQNEQDENLVTKMVLITYLPYTGLVIYTEQNAPHTEIC